MGLKSALLIPLFILAAGCSGSSSSDGKKGVSAESLSLPQVPQYYVLDQTGLFGKSKLLTAIQNVLIEHDRLTGERIMLGVFKTHGEAKPEELAERVFQHWKINRPGKGNGLLFAYFAKEETAVLHAGFGIEGLLSNERIQEILSGTLDSEVSAGNLPRGLALSIVEILRTLESPLVSNNKAMELLRAGGIENVWPAGEGSAATFVIFLLILFGASFLGTSLYFLTAADAHFTSQGWYRPRPWRQLKQYLDKKNTRPHWEGAGIGGSW